MKAVIYMILAVLTIGIVAAIPNAGDIGIDNSYGSYRYKVCRADSNSAWISSYHTGVYNAVTVCQSLGYSGVNEGEWGGTCGTVCGYCGDYGFENYDGAGVNNNDPTRIGRSVHWQCGNYIGGDNNVPEFGMIGGIIVILGAGLVLAYKRK